MTPKHVPTNPSNKGFVISTREDIDASIEIPSILDVTEQARIIRSHRAPRRRISRVVVAGLLAVSVGASAGIVTTNVSRETTDWHEDTAIALTELSPQMIERTAIMQTSRQIKTASTTRKQKIEKVIAFALSQKGDRYKWGATGPNSWDCSGLVMAAFQRGGKRLPHYTGGIATKGTAVSRSHLQRGDIVFPQKGHVGIYLGNGMMVHASSGKGKVVVAKVYGFYKARRVI